MSAEQLVPRIIYITARPYTRKMKRALRSWPGKTHLERCTECGLQAVIAESSKIALDEGLERGDDMRVVCDNCAPKTIAPAAPTMVTEEQVTEAAIVAERQSKRNQN